MTKVFCDFCEVELKQEPIHWKREENNEPAYDKNDTVTYIKKIDICSSCDAQVQRFMDSITKRVGRKA